MTRHIYLVKRPIMCIRQTAEKSLERTVIMSTLLLRKERKRLEKERKLRLKQLEEDIEEINRAIAVAESGFNEVTDVSLTDALIFDRAALEARRNYLLKQAKNVLCSRSEALDI